jgi:hypothetical protein
VQEAAEAVAAPDVAAARQFELRHELAMPAQQRCRCHDEPMLAPVRQQARKRSDEGAAGRPDAAAGEPRPLDDRRRSGDDARAPDVSAAIFRA